jgi:hypothetical protein
MAAFENNMGAELNEDQISVSRSLHGQQGQHTYLQKPEEIVINDESIWGRLCHAMCNKTDGSF